MSGSDSEPDATLGFAAQLDAMRSTVKWLVAGLAAVGAVMVGGLQVASVGELSPVSWRLYVALAAAGTGLGAVGYMLKEATAVLTCEWLTLASFTDDTAPPTLRSSDEPWAWREEEVLRVRKKIEDSRHELYGYVAPGLPQLHARLRRADDLVTASVSGAAADARIEATRLRRAARDVVEYANYCLTVSAFRGLRTRIAWAAAIAATSVAVFACAANPPIPDRPVHVQLEFKQQSAQ